MSFPEEFEATDFFYPTVKQKQDYFITGRDVCIELPDEQFGRFTYSLEEWKEILNIGPPILYKVFGDDNCWVINWKTSTNKENTNYKIAVLMDSDLYKQMFKKAYEIAFP